MNIETILTESIVAVIKELYGEETAANTIQLQKTRKEFEGDFTLVVFPFLSLSRKKPEDTAAEIGEYLTKNDHPEMGGHFSMKRTMSFGVQSIIRQSFSSVSRVIFLFFFSVSSVLLSMPFFRRWY